MVVCYSIQVIESLVELPLATNKTREVVDTNTSYFLSKQAYKLLNSKFNTQLHMYVSQHMANTLYAWFKFSTTQQTTWWYL